MDKWSLALSDSIMIYYLFVFLYAVFIVNSGRNRNIYSASISDTFSLTELQRKACHMLQ